MSLGIWQEESHPKGITWVPDTEGSAEGPGAAWNMTVLERVVAGLVVSNSIYQHTTSEMRGHPRLQIVLHYVSRQRMIHSKTTTSDMHRKSVRSGGC